ncbi:tyrosine-type recombinase/integrase, partial [Salmonella enterica subsp. enterica serovar Montevideo]|nr:tyrosine-type recombinase/integrase [Salmonella enterica subsp. enterica serovar Montevideo]
ASLHDVLVREFNAPYLRLNGEKDPLVVNSCLIPVALYQHMLTQLENHPSINDKLRDVLKLILILLYRTGMRFMEVLSIRLSDIEYDNQGFIDYNIVL